MAYIGNEPADRFTSIPTVQQFNGDASTTAFTLNRAVGSDQELLVSVDGVIQDTAAYAVSNGTTLTFSAAPSQGTANIFVNHLGLTLGSVVHPASSALAATTGAFSGDIDVDGTTNLDVVDIDGAVDMASTLQVDGAITSSAGATITTADNLDTLTLTSTDADANSGPNLRLYRNSSSPADDDFLGTIDFEGRNDNSQDFVAARIFTYTPDVSDGSEDAQLQLSMMKGGSSHIALEIKPTEFVINNGSVDMDFRVEGNGDANMLFVDASADKIGIGTDAPLDLLHLKGGGANDSVGAPIIRLQKRSAGAVSEGQTIGGISWFVQDDGVDSGASKERAKIIAESQNTSSGTRLEFWTGNSNADIAEAMRIIADGTALYGCTALPDGSADGVSLASTQSQRRFSINATSNSNQILFYNGNGNVGNINTNGSATNYVTSSDYRLKENVDYTWDATTRLKQLKPARFNFIADDTNTLVDGFLAHEVSSVVPEAISGTKDAMAVETRYTADDVETQGDTPSKNVNDPKTYSSSVIDPQGIDQSKLVPLLVKTIQELEARITALEA